MNTIQNFKLDETSIVRKPHQFTETGRAVLCLPMVSSDPIVNAYRAGESPNEYMLRLMLECTARGDLVLDLGCHVGTFAVGAAALGRRVVGVDASSFHIALVRDSIDANGFRDFAVHWRAIDEYRATVQIVERGIWTTVVNEPTEDAVSVPASTLDAFASEHLHDRVAFLKMDIEGAELAALRSGKNLLAKSQPVILYESNGMTAKTAGTSVDAIRQELEGLGYKTFRIEGDRWIYSPVGEIQPEGWLDVIALSAADQQRFKGRMDWTWSPEAVYERSVVWAGLPHVNTREYLLEELQSRKFPPAIQKRMSELAVSVAAGLKAA